MAATSRIVRRARPHAPREVRLRTRMGSLSALPMTTLSGGNRGPTYDYRYRGLEGLALEAA